MARLTITSAEGQRDVELTELITIGRHAGCSLVMTDGLLSKHHTKFFPQGGAWYVEDLGSTNGTYVNGIQVQLAELKDGDEIALGGVRARFISPQAPARSATIMPEGVKILQSGLQGIMRAKLGDEQHRGAFLPVDKITDPEQLKRDYEKLRIANVLNEAIGIESDIATLLPRLLDETFKLIPADRGCILLTNELGELEPRAVKRSAEAGDEELVLSNTILSDVVENLSAVLTSDAMMDDRYSGSKSIIAMNMRSTMCVPMVHKGRLLGVLHADSISAVAAFSERDLQLLSGVATQAAQAIDNAQKAKKLERWAIARQSYERLLPPAIVEQVMNSATPLERGGREHSTTVMFTDVRGFTSWSEKHDAQHIVEILNQYFELMVEAIFKNQGTLDKFMGDGIMALFGAPIGSDHDAFNAVNCAVEMMDMLRVFNASLAARGLEQMHIGVGINTGPVVVGYMGSSNSMEYTAIGDQVNLSARLCGVAEAGQVLVSQSTLDAVGGAFETVRLPAVSVKGIKEPVAVHQVLARIEPGSGPTRRADTGVTKTPF